MANLNKLLVHVPSSLCEDFRNKYIKDGANRDKSYDNKIVFLEDTKEIFTKGEIYGINVEDFNALKKLIGTIPSGPSGTKYENIVDYINDKINNANHIHSVSKKSNETLIEISTDNTAKAVTVSSTEALTTAASKANSALQNVSVLGKDLSNHKGTSITKEEAMSYLGLGTDYKDMTYIGTYVHSTAGNYANTAYDNAVSYVRTLFPEVTAKDGSIIKVESSTDAYGKKTYKISTSAEVFHYKGNKTKIKELPSTGNKTGDVWSVGPTNATGSTLYAWDGDEWINLGGANGVTGVDETSISYGIKLVKNQNGTVKASVTTGSVASNNSYFVTGGTVYNYINNLGGNASSENTSSYVNVTVNTSGGKVNTVKVEDTKALKDAVSYANSALQKVKVLGYTLNKSSYCITAQQVKDTLNLREAAHKDMSYFTDYFVSKSSINGDTTVNSDSSYINVSVTTSGGKVNTVTVTPTIELETLLSYAYNSVQAIGTFSEPYISITNENNNKSYYITFDVSEVFSYVTNNIWETYPPE